MSVKKGDLVELKSMAAPPEVVKTVWTAVLLLMGYTQQQAKDWNAAKKFMAHPQDALEKLNSFDKSKLAPEVVAMATEVVAGLSVENVRARSAAASSVFKWVENAIRG